MRNVLPSTADLVQRKIVLGLAAILISAGTARAESCPAPDPQIDAERCTGELFLDANEMIAASSGPAGGARAADRRPPAAEPGVALPLAVDSADTGVGVKTSLGQWRSFDAQLLAARIEGAKAMLPGTLPLPKPANATAPPVDVWTSFDVQGLARDSETTVKSGAGADVRVNTGAVVGVAVERSDTRLANRAAGVQDDKVAAHLTVQASPVLSVDTKTQWETGTTVANSSRARIDTNAISVAPRVKLPIALDGGQTLEPFVTVKDELTHGVVAQEPGAQEPGTKNVVSAGAGVTLSKPDAYSMSVTADVEGLGTSDPANLKSRLQLSIPLR